MDKAPLPEVEALVHTLPPPTDAAAFRAHQDRLHHAVAHLINHDFDRLLRLLYAVDVDERVLKHLLQQQPQPDAAAVITNLLIQRQLQKWETRRQMQSGAPPSDEERW